MYGNVIDEKIEITAEFIEFLHANNLFINLKNGDYGPEFPPRSSRLMIKELVEPLVDMYNNGILHLPTYTKTLGVKNIKLIKNNALRLGIPYKSNDELWNIWIDFVVEKRKATSIENWGYDNPSKSPIIKDKIRNILTLRYGGIGNAVESIRLKYIQTMLESYGVKHNWAHGMLREQLKVKWLLTTGYDHNFKNPQCRAKIIQTWVCNYGVTNPMRCPEVVAKGINTRIDLYHSKSYIGSETYKEKRRSIDIRYDQLLSAIETPIDDPDRAQKFLDALSNYSYGYRFTMNHQHNFYNPKITSLPEIELREFVSDILKDSDYVSIEYNATDSHGIRWSSYVDVYKCPPSDFPHHRKMELDILIKVNDHYSVAVEMNGVHYHAIEGGVEPMHPEYHIVKRLLCQRNGIKLIGVMNFDFYDKDYRKRLGDLINHCVDNPWSDEKIDIMSKCYREQYEVHTHKFNEYTYTDYGHFKVE
nr:MAG TPA: endonuclease-like protein [Caudoviricetes sp.]